MFIRTIQMLVWLPLLWLGWGETEARAADSRPDGAEIYRQLCVKCHGREGEGVKDKYDDALYGDWSLAKLTRYIAKAMPEDAPEKCVGADAEAVARYIHEAFYSRAARARNHPARIELVRLTNRQYLHTVADLLNHFDERDRSTNSARGLRGRYYSVKGFNDDKKIFDRVDRQVDFDYGTGHPDPTRNGTNEFAMQWRGSVRADETGDYEFIVKTPNGIRLWVNDDDQALIEATVASGGVNEQKAVARLIGGRTYPLKLDYFKSNEKRAGVSLQWRPPRGVQEPIPARHLSPERVPSTLVISTPFPADDSSVGYERGIGVSKAWDEATTQAAIEVAHYVVEHLDRLSHSKPAETNRATKVESFCQEFVATAFRRPLTDEQKRLFVSNRLKGAPKMEDGVKRVVLLALKSPRFLYLGLENEQPDDFLVAERLSFALWDSSPDRELSKLAARGELHGRDQVVAQARRMLGDPRARAKMQSFLHQWLQMNRVEDLTKDAQLYPGFTPEIIADLRTSLDLFLEETVWHGASSYRELLLADYLFVNERLAKFYGLNVPATNDFVRVPMGPKERSGVVTHPYLLAAFSYRKSTSPIHRGVFLTRNIVGRSLKPPPMAVVFKDADFSPQLTMREKITELTRPKACQACHSVINPLGFSLEQYDAVGRFRTQENARPIDAIGEYTTDEGETLRFHGARELAEFAAASEPAQHVFIEQLFHLVVKQPMLAYGPEVMSQLRQSFVASELNLQTLLVDIASLSALHGLEQKTASTKKP